MRQGGVFSEPAFFYELAPLAPYELTHVTYMHAHVRPSPGDCGQCGWLGADLRAAGSGEHSRGAAWMLRQGVACSGGVLLSQHIDGVARTGSI